MVARPAPRRRLRDLMSERGHVAMLSALLIPAMTGATGLGVEVSYWGLRQVELQRIADAAALSAANASNAGWTAQNAANAGADVAELNGIAGQATRSWDPTNNILTDNKITIKKVAGIKAAANVAFQAIVKEDINLVITKLVSSMSSVTAAATAYAEIVPGVVQGCVMVTGTTSTALTLNNNAGVNSPSCGLQSNGGVDMENNSTITAKAVTASGSIVQKTGATISGTKMSNQPTFTDLYATDTATQAAFTQANSATATSALTGVANTVTSASPGTYSSLSVGISGTLNLSPGLYIIKGQISMGNNSILNGTGVTILFTDQASFSNNAQINLTAPTATATSGVPGIAMMSKSVQDLALNNNSTMVISGVLYYPNGHIEADNNFGTAATTCSVMYAKTITLNNNAYLANNCTSNSGVKTLNVPTTPTVKLVK